MKVLLTGAFNYSENQIEYLKELGCELTFVQDERQKLPFDVSKFEAVICNGLFIYNNIKDFKSLKFIQLLSAGLDRVPLDYINENGISIFNAKGVYSIPIAEFAVCGILNFYKKFSFFYQSQNDRVWNKNRELIELNGKNAVIVGAGSIGSEIAKRLNAFGVNTCGVDIFEGKDECFKRIVPIAVLDEELANADLVILTLPLTNETRGLFNAKRFDVMKKQPLFVNVARGGLVVEADLVNALSDSKLSGAVLDVFEEEPLNSSSLLWNMDNVIVTPHNSFVGEGNNQRMFEVIVRNLRSSL